MDQGKRNLKYETGSVTHKNSKTGKLTNEDSFWVAQISVPSENPSERVTGAILCVCDGVGGIKAGDYASQAAIRFIRGWFSNGQSRKIDEQALTELMNKTHLHVQEATGKQGAATCSLLMLVGGEWISAHVGDTRIYRNSQKITNDHTVLAERDVKLVPILGDATDPQKLWVSHQKTETFGGEHSEMPATSLVKASDKALCRDAHLWLRNGQQPPTIPSIMHVYSADTKFRDDQKVMVMVNNVLSLRPFNNYRAALRKQASTLTVALGSPQIEKIEPEIHKGTYRDGDFFLIGSDGFWHHLEKISGWDDLLQNTPDIKKTLTEMAHYFRGLKEKDDMTAALVRCRKNIEGAA